MSKGSGSTAQGSSDLDSPRTPSADHWRQRKERICSRNMFLKFFCDISVSHMRQDILHALFETRRNVVGHAPSRRFFQFFFGGIRSHEVILMVAGALIDHGIEVKM